MSVKYKQSLLVLIGHALTYIVIRYLLFDFHQMKDWPTFLFVVSLLVTVFGLIKGYKYLSLTSPFGYAIGYIISVLFSTEELDPGGGFTNNMWFIWMGCLALLLAIGFLVDLKVRSSRD